MKIGLLSDIHANLPALEAVLADMPPVDEIVCVGDIIGYNPWPAACVDRIREISTITVQGNHDRNVETPEQYALNKMAHAGLKYAQKNLSNNQRRWLQDLPRTETIVDGKHLLVHSHPEREDEYVYPQNYLNLRSYLGDYSGIILGHTHIQHTAEVDGGIIANPGSVGQPRDGNPHAAYAILDTTTNKISPQRVYYNIDRAYHEIIVEGLPEQTGKRLFNAE